jgi:NitT/TauT family transport system ATP-binding protein
MAMIEIKNVNKRYGDKVVYKDFSLNFEEYKTTAILGESGSGKTTLLNMIVGLTDYLGEIKGDFLPVSVVFQNDRLVGNLTVLENIKLVVKNLSEEEIKDKLTEIGLKDYINEYPKTLSKGMARRVSLLRAFLYPSKTLLMDEPFVNLDIALKYSLMDWVKELKEQTHKTVLFITHDIKEAVYLSDRVVVLKNGEIVKDIKEVKEKTESELFGLMLNK